MAKRRTPACTSAWHVIHQQTPDPLTHLRACSSCICSALASTLLSCCSACNAVRKQPTECDPQHAPQMRVQIAAVKAPAGSVAQQARSCTTKPSCASPPVGRAGRRVPPAAAAVAPACSPAPQQAGQPDALALPAPAGRAAAQPSRLCAILLRRLQAGQPCQAQRVAAAAPLACPAPAAAAAQRAAVLRQRG